jgi:hypothetical protein
MGTVWFLAAKLAHQLTDHLACGDGSPNISLNICSCPTISIDESSDQQTHGLSQGIQLVRIGGTSIEVFITRS